MDDWYCGPIPAALSNKVLADERSEYVDCCIPKALSSKVLADETSGYVEYCIGKLVSVEVGLKGGASLP
jgi:hypothetical protein